MLHRVKAWLNPSSGAWSSACPRVFPGHSGVDDGRSFFMIPSRWRPRRAYRLVLSATLHGLYSPRCVVWGVRICAWRLGNGFDPCGRCGGVAGFVALAVVLLVVQVGINPVTGTEESQLLLNSSYVSYPGFNGTRNRIQQNPQMVGPSIGVRFHATSIKNQLIVSVVCRIADATRR